MSGIISKDSGTDTSVGQATTAEAQSIGAALRKGREDAGISLDAAAAATRIPRRHLEALEADRLDLLPGTIYARQFLRTHAEHVGLDPEPFVEALDDWLAQHQQPTKQARRKRGGLGPWVVAAFVAAAAVTGAVFAWSALQGEDAAVVTAGDPPPATTKSEPARTTPSATPVTTAGRTGGAAAVPVTAAAESRQPEESAALSDDAVTSGSDDGSSGTSTESATESDDATSEVTEAVETPPATEPETTPSADEPEPVVESAAEPVATPPVLELTPPPRRPAPPKEEPPILRLVFTAASWIEVEREGVAEPLLGLQDAGEELSFILDRPMEIRLGNAGGVRLEIDGRTARPLGAAGEGRILRLDPQNWRTLLR
ncbi:MAG: RodZ domain-containing protein [Acidobacteriota bacterium]